MMEQLVYKVESAIYSNSVITGYERNGQVVV